MYHAQAHALIQVVKSLSACSTDAAVALRVLKRQLPDGCGYAPDKGCRVPIKRAPYPCHIVAKWRLPSPQRDGDEVSSVECGASLMRVKAAVEQMVSSDPAMAADPTFYVWSEKTISGRVMGRFDDTG